MVPTSEGSVMALQGNLDVKKILFVPDTHRPYHDARAVRLMMKVARRLKPDHIVVLGDYGDFYATSRHPKNPNRAALLEYEIASNNEGLDELDSLGAAHKMFVAGNHEDNVSRYLMEKAPQLFNIVKIENLLRLKERGWKYVPYKDHAKIGKIYVTHESGRSGQNAHIQASAKFRSSVVIGHTHRLAISHSTTVTGKGHVAAMFGWLGDAKKAEYMYRVNTTDWKLGFGVGFMESNGFVHLHACPITNYKTELNGELFVG